MPLTPLNLEPFSTLLLIQTLFVHGEQAPDFANNFQAHVSSLAFPAEMTESYNALIGTILFQSLCSSILQIHLHDKSKEMTYHFLI